MLCRKLALTKTYIRKVAVWSNPPLSVTYIATFMAGWVLIDALVKIKQQRPEANEKVGLVIYIVVLYSDRNSRESHYVSHNVDLSPILTTNLGHCIP